MSITNRTISVNGSDLVATDRSFIYSPYPTFDIPLYRDTNFNPFDDFRRNPVVNTTVRDLKIKSFLKYVAICSFNKRISIDIKDKRIVINVFNLPSFRIFNEDKLDILYLTEKINPFISEYRDDLSFSNPYSSDIFSLYTLRNDKYKQIYSFVNIKDSSILKDIESFRFEIFCLCEALLRILQKENIFYLLFAEIVNTMITGVNTGEGPSDDCYKNYISRFSKNDPK